MSFPVFKGLREIIETAEDCGGRQRHEGARSCCFRCDLESCRSWFEKIPLTNFLIQNRGYQSESTLPISDDICLTATVDILRAITRGKGPKRATMMLGYSGWGAGQLENEVSANGWLTCPADEDIIFDADLDAKYNGAFAAMGIDPAMLSRDCGQA